MAEKIRVHTLDTGRVQIHRRQVDPHRVDALRLPATLVDRHWTPWLPVWGHTAGHQSVLVAPGEGPRVLIAGDAVYSEDALREGRIDGVATSPKLARASVERMQRLCREAPTVVAPTHDTGSADRVRGATPTDLN